MKINAEYNLWVQYWLDMKISWGEEDVFLFHEVNKVERKEDNSWYSVSLHYDD